MNGGVGVNRAGFGLLARELRARRGPVTRILLWSVLESLPTLLSGLATATALEHFLEHDIIGALVILALLLTTAAMGALATRRMFPWLAAVVEPVRDAFVTAVVKGAVIAAVASPDRQDTASVARLTEQVQAVRNILSALLRVMRQSVFGFASALAGLVLLAPAIALVSGALVAIAVTLFALLLPSLTARCKAVLLAEEGVAQGAGTAFGSVRDVIACAAEHRAVGEVGRAIDTEAALTRSQARATALRSLAVFVGAHLPLIVVLAGAPWLLREGHLTVPELVGAVTYLTVSLEPTLRNLVGMLGGWGIELFVTLDRLGEGIPGPEPSAERVVAWPQRYELAISGLTFAYGPHAEPVVRHLDLIVAQGDHLAVVGPSGIGKSTLANLLTGLLTPQSGVVRLGGCDITRLREAGLRQTLALIPQEAYVFAGSLRENLTYLAPSATERELTAAAEAVGLHAVVERLGGLDARVGTGGAELSAGEKQLIALTRVYLSPALVVILDEATSNLDPIAEARVETAFARREGTLVVIAHRISSARRARRILLLDGQSVHLGSHGELLATSSLYADLVGQWEAPAPAAGRTNADQGDSVPAVPAN